MNLPLVNTHKCNPGPQNLRPAPSQSCHKLWATCQTQIGHAQSYSTGKGTEIHSDREPGGHKGKFPGFAPQSPSSCVQMPKNILGAVVLCIGRHLLSPSLISSWFLFPFLSFRGWVLLCSPGWPGRERSCLKFPNQEVGR